MTDMVDSPRNLTLERAACEPDRAACRSQSLRAADGGAGPQSATCARRFLLPARPRALPSVFNETAAKGGDKLPAHFPLAAGNGCSSKSSSKFPASLAGDWICSPLAKDWSLGSERDFYESRR